MEQYGARGQSSGPGPPPNNGPFSQSVTGVDIPNGHADSPVCECSYLMLFQEERVHNRRAHSDKHASEAALATQY
ncbi:hypothetical protein DPX16_15185 [Anabarilius grahami]|uniref:Uncharacterized protein n=1 Tax=Anabarilius grahami TaxID=495550 RepID=A0A3N0YVC0_ANAGA|nr:hypothetical protein DPX16_15185 [Anabarilius grahami]